MRSKRFLEIDLLKGLAVIGMIAFHVFFVLDFYGIANYDMYSGWLLILARFVQFSFIGLVGVSLAISWERSKHKLSLKEYRIRNFKRGLIVLSLGYLITLVTYLAIPGQYVRFGILHLIGLGIILFSLVSHRKYISLFIGIGIFALTPLVREIFPISDSYAIDHFSIFPWFSLIGIGIYIGHIMHKKLHTDLPIKIPAPILFVGKHSLIIYLVHVPAIISILVLLGILPFSTIF